MKSPGRIIEEYAGWAAFVIGFVVACFISPEKYHYSELINGFPAIGLGIFGFMLTFIAIILQSSNNTIDYMKSQETLFKCFVDYNKRVVFVSAILEKPREFDPRGQATLTPASKNTLTPYGKIKMTPENNCCFRGFL